MARRRGRMRQVLPVMIATAPQWRFTRAGLSYLVMSPLPIPWLPPPLLSPTGIRC